MNLASLAEQNLAEYGEYERLVFEGRPYTNRELHESELPPRARARSRSGAATGDKVVLMMPNAPEVFVDLPGDLARRARRRPGALPARRARARVHPRELGGPGRRHLAGGLRRRCRRRLRRVPGARSRVVVAGEASRRPGCAVLRRASSRGPPLGRCRPPRGPTTRDHPLYERHDRAAEGRRPDARQPARERAERVELGDDARPDRDRRCSSCRSRTPSG